MYNRGGKKKQEERKCCDLQERPGEGYEIEDRTICKTFLTKGKATQATALRYINRRLFTAVRYTPASPHSPAFQSCQGTDRTLYRNGSLKERCAPGKNHFLNPARRIGIKRIGQENRGSGSGGVCRWLCLCLLLTALVSTRRVQLLCYSYSLQLLADIQGRLKMSPSWTFDLNIPSLTVLQQVFASLCCPDRDLTDTRHPRDTTWPISEPPPPWMSRTIPTASWPHHSFVCWDKTRHHH